MLLPNQITKHPFTYSKGMYKASEVDAFLEQIAASYDKTVRENAELVKKLGLLADMVEDYREKEERNRVEFLGAQKTAEQMIANARRESERIIQNASIEAQNILASAKSEKRKRRPLHFVFHIDPDDVKRLLESQG